MSNNLKQISSVNKAVSWEAHWHILCSITECCFSLQEKDGVEEVLFTHHHHVNNSTSFKGRIRLGGDYRLHLSPVQIQDDGRTFSCHLTVNPLKAWKMSTTVKVFGKEFVLWSLCHLCVNASGHALLMRGAPTPTLAPGWRATTQGNSCNSVCLNSYHSHWG